MVGHKTNNLTMNENENEKITKNGQKLKGHKKDLVCMCVSTVVPGRADVH